MPSVGDFEVISQYHHFRLIAHSVYFLKATIHTLFDIGTMDYNTNQYSPFDYVNDKGDKVKTNWSMLTIDGEDFDKNGRPVRVSIFFSRFVVLQN